MVRVLRTMIALLRAGGFHSPGRGTLGGKSDARVRAPRNGESCCRFDRAAVPLRKKTYGSPGTYHYLNTARTLTLVLTCVGPLTACFDGLVALEYGWTFEDGNRCCVFVSAHVHTWPSGNLPRRQTTLIPWVRPTTASAS